MVDSQRLLLMAENPEDVVKKLESEAGERQQMEFEKPNQWNQIFLCGIFLGNTFLNVCGECFLWGIFCFR